MSSFSIFQPQTGFVRVMTTASAGSPPTPPRRRPPVSREVALAALTVAVVILFSILFPTSFRSFDNFAAILRNLAFEGILAIGMMMMMVGGTFDLSVGAMASMIGVVT